MIYVVFIISNYISLGIGVWIAIRHGEIARNQLTQKNLQQSRSLLETQEILSDPNLNEYQVVGDNDGQISEINLSENKENSTDNRFVAEEPTLNADVKFSPPHAQEWRADALFVNELPPTAHLPLPSGEMVEQLVGMIKEEGTGELVPLASELQEIHDMLTSTDKRYYASADAKFFVTPDEQKYASTAICRPIVGRKH